MCTCPCEGYSRQGRARLGSSFLLGSTAPHPHNYAPSSQQATTLSSCPFPLGLGSRKSLDDTGLGRGWIDRCLLAVKVKVQSTIFWTVSLSSEALSSSVQAQSTQVIYSYPRDTAAPWTRGVGGEDSDFSFESVLKHLGQGVG